MTELFAGDEDTWIIPAVQLGFIGVRQDEQMTTELINFAEPGGTLTASSPYFNLARPYKKALAAALQARLKKSLVVVATGIMQLKVDFACHFDTHPGPSLFPT